uniref:Uncharacterized protein n=1 Tax=Spongospora subterranea TaxID=70186 RepID=A0A0H5QKQ2_9EUKA|eukprot:CRZ01891.1 hypothetical protein [Spongospora subterranea]
MNALEFTRYRFSSLAIPLTIAAVPTICWVGHTLRHLTTLGIQIEKYREDLENDGCIEVYTEASSSRIIGAVCIGYYAYPIILQISTVMQSNTGFKELENIVSKVELLPLLRMAIKTSHSVEKPYSFTAIRRKLFKKIYR